MTAADCYTSVKMRCTFVGTDWSLPFETCRTSRTATITEQGIQVSNANFHSESLTHLVIVVALRLES